MSEEYREYRRKRTSSADKREKRIAFPKKLGWQTAISLALLIAVCTFKFSFKENIINTYIKSAVLYHPDTSGLTNLLGGILNLYTEEGNNNEENKIPENL